MRNCLQCDDGTQLVNEVKDVTLQQSGSTIVVHAVEGWHCPHCGEIEFQGNSAARYFAALQQLKMSIQAA